MAKAKLEDILNTANSEAPAEAPVEAAAEVVEVIDNSDVVLFRATTPDKTEFNIQIGDANGDYTVVGGYDPAYQRVIWRCPKGLAHVLDKHWHVQTGRVERLPE